MRFLTRFVCAALLLLALPAQASETHVVAAGQTLGRIADRYNVTIAALCYPLGRRFCGRLGGARIRLRRDSRTLHRGRSLGRSRARSR